MARDHEHKEPPAGAAHHTSAGGHDLTRLEETYDLQTELHRGRATVTYLARHREHGRDVTVTVLEAATPPERNALTHLAADTRMLATRRHPHVVPVIETRWLAANRLAVARARVRGSTVRQALDAVGPMPEPRVIEVLTEVGGILDWAAQGGVVHRQLDSDSVCFQKGNGKVMVSFGLPASLEGDGPARGADDTGFLFERCADGATLARLGYEMLTAHRAADASMANLRAVRTDLSPRMLAAIEAGLKCEATAPALDARQFVTMLTGEAPAIGAAGIATAASAAVVPRGATAPVPPPVLPLGGPQVGHPGPGYIPPPPSATAAGPGYAAPRRRRGRGMLVISMLALAVLIGGTFFLISRDRDTGADVRVASADRSSEEAGDVDVPVAELPPDPGGLTVDGAQPPVDTMVPGGIPVPPPGEAVPPQVVPPEAAPAPPPAPRNVCESPDPADQRACLAQRIEANDVELTSVYQALIRAVGDRDGAGAAEILRSQQRDWLQQRDRQCRDAGAGDLWAAERARCFARVSNARALELARALAAVRNAPPR